MSEFHANSDADGAPACHRRARHRHQSVGCLFWTNTHTRRTTTTTRRRRARRRRPPGRNYLNFVVSYANRFDRFGDARRAVVVEKGIFERVGARRGAAVCPSESAPTGRDPPWNPRDATRGGRARTDKRTRRVFVRLIREGVGSDRRRASSSSARIERRIDDVRRTVVRRRRRRFVITSGGVTNSIHADERRVGGERGAGDEWGGETRWGAARDGDARVCVRCEREQERDGDDGERGTRRCGEIGAGV